MDIAFEYYYLPLTQMLGEGIESIFNCAIQQNVPWRPYTVAVSGALELQ